MRSIFTIARRELGAYFSTPLAYVFIVAFVAAAGAAPFYFGGFMETRQADLTAFFSFHPWLFLMLIPAIGMRLWAEERRHGTIELLMALPVTPGQAVAGKYLAAWTLVALNLVLTFPIWITVNYLGDPDNGVIATSYMASFLMGGAMLAVTSCLSALTRSTVVAFVLSVAAVFLMMMSGLDLVLNLLAGWAPSVMGLVASFSLLTHFSAVARGAIETNAILYFVSVILLFLFINRQIVEIWKAG